MYTSPEKMSIKRVSYVADLEAWRQHLVNRDNFKDKKSYYEVKKIRKDPHTVQPQVQVNLVYPVQQAVEQAKSELKKKKLTYRWDK